AKVQEGTSPFYPSESGQSSVRERILSYDILVKKTEICFDAGLRSKRLSTIKLEIEQSRDCEFHASLNSSAALTCYSCVIRSQKGCRCSHDDRRPCR
ncbi:unnamed protein product, partial [Mycena citricolor]